MSVTPAKMTVLLFAVLLVVAGNAGTARAQGAVNFDHLKCYKIKDFNQILFKKGYAMDLVPEQTQFLTEVGCVIPQRANWFCIDVHKQNVQPAPPFPQLGGVKAQDYLCYRLKCPKIDLTLLVTDQFGQRDILVKKPHHLCVPAQKGPPPVPTPTVTATPVPPTPTATSTPGLPCDFDPAGICNGDCPPPFPAGSKCLFNAAVGLCRCEPPGNMCMTDAVGVCAGLCPDPADVCVQPPGATCDCFKGCGPGPSPHQCSGICPPGLICQILPADGCDCLPPPGPSCEGVGGPACDGGCPNANEACVAGPPPNDCFCEGGTPPACGQLQGPPVCWGACPVGQACVFDPTTAAGCICN